MEPTPPSDQDVRPTPRPGPPSAAPRPGPPSASPPTSRADGAPTTAAVASALTGLDGLAERPLSEHPDAYQRIHAELQRALSDIDNT